MTNNDLLKTLIEKRKELFKTDPQKDQSFVEYAANKILKDKEAVREIKAKPWLLIELMLTIVDKKKKSIPFFLNAVQKEFLSYFQELGTEKPYFILKGRQQGFTTLITAMQLCYCITRKNFSGFTVADCTDNVNAIFNDKAKTVYNALPKIMKPHEKYNSRKELFFDKLNSSWRISTAGDSTGRSRTLEFAHFSEVAFYETSLSELQKGIGEALTQNAVVIYETTANGYNEAKDLWDSESCNNLFFEWWKTDEYRLNRPVEYEKIKDKDLLKRIEWLRDKKGLDEKQIAWYVNKYNGYLDKNSIKQEYPCTPEEAFISSGECEFDKEKILERLRNVSGNNKKVEFSYKISRNDYSKEIFDIRLDECIAGDITIFEEPLETESYCIGGDTAGSGEDYFTAVVVKNSDAKTVAQYKVKRIDEDLYARQIYCLGKYYNDALVAIEVNFSVTPIRELIELDYPCLYKRSDGIDGVGFKTTAITRPIIINELKAAFREDSTIECSKDILMEMLSFIKNKSGRAEAANGKHDDLVMAKAIANHVRNTVDTASARSKSFIENNFKITATNKFIEWE